MLIVTLLLTTHRYRSRSRPLTRRERGREAQLNAPVLALTNALVLLDSSESLSKSLGHELIALPCRYAAFPAAQWPSCSRFAKGLQRQGELSATPRSRFLRQGSRHLLTYSSRLAARVQIMNEGMIGTRRRPGGSPFSRSTPRDLKRARFFRLRRRRTERGGGWRGEGRIVELVTRYLSSSRQSILVLKQSREEDSPGESSGDPRNRIKGTTGAGLESRRRNRSSRDHDEIVAERIFGANHPRSIVRDLLIGGRDRDHF